MIEVETMDNEEQPAVSIDPTEEPQANPAEDHQMYIGDPFALSAGGTALLYKDENTPGCFATLQCVCGQQFIFNLLTANVKACPHCDERYTHMLAVCKEDDASMVPFVLKEIWMANDLIPNPEENDEDGNDDDGGEQETEIPEANEVEETEE